MGSDTHAEPPATTLASPEEYTVLIKSTKDRGSFVVMVEVKDMTGIVVSPPNNITNSGTASGYIARQALRIQQSQEDLGCLR